jgi:hypothetical protein
MTTTLLSAPFHERCVGLADHSKRSWGGADISVKADDPNYEAVVTMHEHGKGVIARPSSWWLPLWSLVPLVNLLIAFPN